MVFVQRDDFSFGVRDPGHGATGLVQGNQLL